MVQQSTSAASGVTLPGFQSQLYPLLRFLSYSVPVFLVHKVELMTATTPQGGREDYIN